MREEQSPLTPANTNRDTIYRRSNTNSAASRVIRNILLAILIAIIITCIEVVVLWLTGPSHSLASLLAIPGHSPLLVFVPFVAEVVVVFIVAQVIAMPRAISAYVREVQKEQELYRRLYTPLNSWPALYETSTTYYQENPDPTIHNARQNLSFPGLAQQRNAHLLLLGEPGAGKTVALYLYRYHLLQRRRELVSGREKVPIYVPLENYNLFLEMRRSSQGEVAEAPLLDFLSAADLPGIHRLQPYLSKLVKQGRLVFLCDGLDKLDPGYLPGVCTEFARLLGQTSNRLVITGREVDSREQPQLAQLVAEHLVAHAVISPLSLEQMRSFIERYIEEQEPGKRWQHTAGQIMDVIEHSRLRFQCANPLLFFAFMQVIDGIGVERGKQIDTRGRLLREFVTHLIRQGQSQVNGRQNGNGGNRDIQMEQDLRLLLGEIAWIMLARISPSSHPFIISPAGGHKAPHSAQHLPRPYGFDQLDERVLGWLDEYRSQSAVGSVVPSLEGARWVDDREYGVRLLQVAQRATLIGIGSDGLLSFRHELIADYFVAEYLLALDGQAQSHLTLVEALLANINLQEGNVGGQWIAPIAMWAGLVDEPLELAERFVEQGMDHPVHLLEALALSLMCIGVAWTSPQASIQRQLVLPPRLEEALVAAVSDVATRGRFATVFTRCAEEGGQEIYQALVPLLMLNGIEELFVMLNNTLVPQLLFNYLCDIVDDLGHETEVKRLIRVLGRFGDAAVPRATELSQATPTRSGRLRSAAINILGGTREGSAVEPLIVCLGDANTFIVDRAVSALIRLGPELALMRVIAVLESRSANPAREQMQLAALRILERYLDGTNAAWQLTPPQHQHILEAMLPVLAGNYPPQVQQRASDILVRQGSVAGGREGGEKTVEMLVQKLASEDEAVARNVVRMLKEIGPVATPALLMQLGTQSPEVVRIYIVEVLGAVRDQQALPQLLRLVADPSLMVQQQVANALRTYAPESIPGLINLVLHGESEAVASRAEQILGDIGEQVVRPVIQALFPVVPERTSLLVHVLEHVQEPQAIPALISLLEMPHVEQPLAIAVVHALGQFRDKRVVQPLLNTLANTQPLIYEVAINALSNLGEIALDRLIAALDVEQITAVTPRVQRALLGMIDFPGERLLAAVARGSDAQARNIMDVFLSKGSEAAQLLVAHLFNEDMRVRGYVRQTLARMNGRVIVPALLDVLNAPSPAWRSAVAELLLKHPQEAIPPLVGLLSEYERGDAAQDILLQFGPVILPALVSGLDDLNSRTQERSQYIVVTLVQRTPEVLSSVVQLFHLSLPSRAREALLDVLTRDLVDVSIPALLEGLEDAHLVGDVSEALVRLVHKHDKNSEVVMRGLLEGLCNEDRRHGAEIVLIDIGAEAVPVVGELITDPDDLVAQAAQNILSQIGVPAFPFIWAAHSDMSNLARRTAALNVFHGMSTMVIKDELVKLLTSDDSQDITMALTLLLERIHDEAAQPDVDQEMIPALLEYVQTHADERASLRIIALLLLLGWGTIIDAMTQVLYDYPNHQERLVQAFLLLGEEAGDALVEILRDPDAPPKLHAEVAGVLGMLTQHADVSQYASTIGNYGLWAGRSTGRTTLLEPEQLAIALRALGGLLAGGHWNIARLQELRRVSKEGSAERELYDILLGWRYSPRIQALENELKAEREEHEKNLQDFTQQLLLKQVQIREMEMELEQLQEEHSARGAELDRTTREKESLQDLVHQHVQDKESLQDDLQYARQQNQALRQTLQQVTQRRDALEAQNEQLRGFSERLEEELNNLRGPRKK